MEQLLCRAEIALLKHGVVFQGSFLAGVSGNVSPMRSCESQAVSPHFQNKLDPHSTIVALRIQAAFSSSRGVATPAKPSCVSSPCMMSEALTATYLSQNDEIRDLVHQKTCRIKSSPRVI